MDILNITNDFISENITITIQPIKFSISGILLFLFLVGFIIWKTIGRCLESKFWVNFYAHLILLDVISRDRANAENRIFYKV